MLMLSTSDFDASRKSRPSIIVIDLVASTSFLTGPFEDNSVTRSIVARISVKDKVFSCRVGKGAFAEPVVVEPSPSIK